MKTLSALDIAASIAPSTNFDMEQEDNESLARGAFALVCAAESFEEVVSEKYKFLANELSSAAIDFFSSFTHHFKRTDFVLTIPEAKFYAYDRFEKIFMCIDLLVEDFSEDDWRAQLAWRNVYDYAKAVKTGLVRCAA